MDSRIELCSAKPRPRTGYRFDLDSKKLLSSPFVKVQDESEEDTSHMVQETIPFEIPRQYHIDSCFNEAPWVLLSLDPEAISPNPLKHAMTMLSMTISTVMCLAAGKNDFAEEHLNWVYTYLYNIRDEIGHIPPNIQGIMNHIKKIGGDKIKLIQITAKPKGPCDLSSSGQGKEKVSKKIEEKPKEPIVAEPPAEESEDSPKDSPPNE